MKELKDLKLMTLEKLNELSEKDLQKELVANGKKLYTLKMKKEVGELKQSHLIKAVRVYIAKINTIASRKWFNIG